MLTLQHCMSSFVIQKRTIGLLKAEAFVHCIKVGLSKNCQ